MASRMGKKMKNTVFQQKTLFVSEKTVFFARNPAFHAKNNVFQQIYFPGLRNGVFL